MGKKKKITQQEEEYKPKKRCAAEGCGNRKQVGEYCLSCYYCNNKNVVIILQYDSTFSTRD